MILNKDHAGRHAEAVEAFPADCGGTTRGMNPAERESPGLPKQCLRFVGGVRSWSGNNHEQVCSIESLPCRIILALPTTVDATPFTWTGVYIGGNAGAGWGGDSTSVDLEGFNYFAANPAPGEVTKVGDDTAFIGGGQIGYNYAFNKVVAGIEADFQHSISAQLKSRRVQRQTGGRTLVWC